MREAKNKKGDKMKSIKLNKPNEPATRKQLYMLHILTGEDTRNWKLTKQEASNKISELKGNGNKELQESRKVIKCKSRKDLARKLEKAEDVGIAYNTTAYYLNGRLYIIEDIPDPVHSRSIIRLKEIGKEEVTIWRKTRLAKQLQQNK